MNEETKNALQEVATFKGETLSSLALKAINEMLENEFDNQALAQILSTRKPNEKNYPIENLFNEYGI